MRGSYECAPVTHSNSRLVNLIIFRMSDSGGKRGFWATQACLAVHLDASFTMQYLDDGFGFGLILILMVVVMVMMMGRVLLGCLKRSKKSS